VARETERHEKKTHVWGQSGENKNVTGWEKKPKRRYGKKAGNTHKGFKREVVAKTGGGGKTTTLSFKFMLGGAGIYKSCRTGLRQPKKNNCHHSGGKKGTVST